MMHPTSHRTLHPSTNYTRHPLLLTCCCLAIFIQLVHLYAVAGTSHRPHRLEEDDTRTLVDADTLVSANRLESSWIVATNPLKVGGPNTPDPDVVRIERDGMEPIYLLTHTVGNSDIPIYISSDLVNWNFSTYAFGGIKSAGPNSLQLGNSFYCGIWAPELRPSLTMGGYILSFTASRFDTMQTPCPGYDEGSGVFVSWSPSPFGPFNSEDPSNEFHPQPTGTNLEYCPQEIHDNLPFSWPVDHHDCSPVLCNNTMRLDSDLFNDPLTGESWFSYAWYSNSQPINDWDQANAGEHTSIVKVNASDPRYVICGSSDEVTKVWAVSPHDSNLLAQLNSSCPRCSEQLSFFKGRKGEIMMRGTAAWGVAEASMLFRRGDYVYLLASHSAWDSAFYSVLWIAARTVEELDMVDGDRITGRFLIPSLNQSFGHGTAILGPDNEHWYYIHHHLNHDNCQTTGDPCPRNIYISPLNFVDRGDGRGDVYIQEVFPAEQLQVEVYQSTAPILGTLAPTIQLRTTSRSRFHQQQPAVAPADPSSALPNLPLPPLYPNDICRTPAGAERLELLLSAYSLGRLNTTIGGAGGASSMEVVDATVVLNAFLNNFALDASHLSISANSTQPGNYWNVAVGISSLVDSYRMLTGFNTQTELSNQILEFAQDILVTQAKSPSGFLRDWFDDEDWMVAALLDVYEMNPNNTDLLDEAVALFNDVLVNGWDNQTQTMWWDKPHTQHATASNAGTIVVALRFVQLNISLNEVFERLKLKSEQLFFEGRDVDTDMEFNAIRNFISPSPFWNDLLSFTQALYTRWNSYTLASGEIIDHIDDSGHAIYYGNGFTYNQALMIQSSFLLHLQTNNFTYLENANQMLTFMSLNQTVNGVLADCSTDPAGTCSDDCSQFKGIGVRALSQYMTYLSTVIFNLLAEEDDSIQTAFLGPAADAFCTAQSVFSASVSSAWIQSQSPDHLFSCQWQSPWLQETVLLGAQNSAVSAFAQWAMSVHLINETDPLEVTIGTVVSHTWLGLGAHSNPYVYIPPQYKTPYPPTSPQAIENGEEQMMELGPQITRVYVHPEIFSNETFSDEQLPHLYHLVDNAAKTGKVNLDFWYLPNGYRSTPAEIKNVTDLYSAFFKNCTDQHPDTLFIASIQNEPDGSKHYTPQFMLPVYEQLNASLIEAFGSYENLRQHVQLVIGDLTGEGAVKWADYLVPLLKGRVDGFSFHVYRHDGETSAAFNQRIQSISAPVLQLSEPFRPILHLQEYGARGARSAHAGDEPGFVPGTTIPMCQSPMGAFQEAEVLLLAARAGFNQFTRWGSNPGGGQAWTAWAWGTVLSEDTGDIQLLPPYYLTKLFLDSIPEGWLVMSDSSTTESDAASSSSSSSFSSPPSFSSISASLLPPDNSFTLTFRPPSNDDEVGNSTISSGGGAVIVTNSVLSSLRVNVNGFESNQPVLLSIYNEGGYGLLSQTITSASNEGVVSLVLPSKGVGAVSTNIPN